MGFRSIDAQGRIKGVGATGPAGPSNALTGTYAARPSAGEAGRLYLPSDGMTMARDTGAAWDTFGPFFPMANPPTGVWSWRNQGSSTISETKDALLLLAAGTGNAANIVARVKTSYPTTPFTISAYILGAPFAKNNHGWGMFLRQNGAGTGVNRVRTFGIAQFVASASIPGQGITVWGAASETSTYTDFSFSQPITESVKWFRINDDGTNLKYSISADGQNWVQVYSETRTAYLLQGPDQIGFFAYTQNTATPNLDQPVSVLSWKQS